MSGGKKEEAMKCLPDLSASGVSLQVVVSPSRRPAPTEQYLL